MQDDAPWLATYVPAVHNEHALWPGTEKWPTPHNLQLACAALLKYPPPQATQDPCP